MKGTPISIPTTPTSRKSKKSVCIQKHLTRCDKELRPISLEEARQRLGEQSPHQRRSLIPSSIRFPSDLSLGEQSNDESGSSTRSLRDSAELEKKIIALDYRIRFDSCVSSAI
mmetsp:Transcript_40004/g.45518  ORF Transcript_40004/g.45518 Transcript_40004/m.45518 type:complete len:113 (-) Transcript_40004:51-389(-)